MVWMRLSVSASALPFWSVLWSVQLSALLRAWELVFLWAYYIIIRLK